MPIKVLTERDLEDGKFASQILKAPMHADSVSRAVPLIAQSEDRTLVTLWLHAKQKRTCWYFKALHEYEAFVTTGQDESSPRYAVDSIGIYIQREKDNANYTHTCGAGDYCAKSDEIVATFGACGWSVSYATATIHGQSWSTNPTRID